MLLSILIPTYNRAPFLLKNLEMLVSFIRKKRLENEIELIVSNNQSSDKTDIEVKEFISSYVDIDIKYFMQACNIGLEKNALFVLKEARSTYVMFLGDDDFIDFNFFVRVIDHLKHNKNTFSIIPTFVPINIEGEIIGKSRDHNIDSNISKAGFLNCFKNSWRAHQLSGLVLKREGLYEEYHKRKVNNIYPFIFLLAFSCLKGDSFHFTEFPVKVTKPGQQNKDWAYGHDGLVNDVFDNYKKLPLNGFEKTFLQLEFFKHQQWRLLNYKKYGLKSFFSAFYRIWFAKNSTFGFKIIFPFDFFRLIAYSKLQNIIN